MTAVVRRNDPAGVERVLRSLPAWFGVEEALLGYVERAAVLDSHLVVDDDGTTLGVVLVERHFPESAELHLVAVHADHRGRGLGTALVGDAEAVLRADGCVFLEVHTVGPSFADEGYAATRAFYASVGFSPLHEHDRLDWDGPTLVMVKPLWAVTPSVDAGDPGSLP